jgi:hypothetical protein
MNYMNNRRPRLALLIIVVLAVIIAVPARFLRERQKNSGIWIDPLLKEEVAYWITSHKIAGIPIEVKDVVFKLDVIEVAGKMHGSIAGHSDRFTRTISIKRDVLNRGDGSRLRWTVWHEMGHAVWGWDHPDEISIMHPTIPLHDISEEEWNLSKDNYLKCAVDAYHKQFKSFWNGY